MIKAGRALEIFESRLKSIISSATDVLDIGTSERFAKELRPYENLFLECKYIAAGFEPSSNHDKYNCDMHQDIQNMTFDDASFNAVICLEVLEHVRNPFKAVDEIKRVLRPDGRLFLTVPFLTQYHGKGGRSAKHSEYPDFWRFTHQGLQILFENFQELEVIPLDGPIEFRLKQFYLTPLLDTSFIRQLIDFIDQPKLGKATTRHLVIGKK